MEEEMNESNAENEMEEEMTTEELAYDNHIAISTLLEILFEKGIITEKEYQEKLDKMDSEGEDGAEEQ